MTTTSAYEESLLNQGRKLHNAWFDGPDMEPRDRMIRMAKVARELHRTQQIDMAPEYTDEMTPLDTRRDELAREGWGIQYYGLISSARTKRFIDRIIELENEAAK